MITWHMALPVSSFERSYDKNGMKVKKRKKNTRGKKKKKLV